MAHDTAGDGESRLPYVTDRERPYPTVGLVVQENLNAQPVRLTVSDDLRRDRGSVFFRAWLALPLMLWLGVLAIAVFPISIANWVATLLLGRSPEPLHRFLARFVRYATHAFAYLNLGAGPLPRFNGEPGYAIDVEIDPPGRQSRWSVAFRMVLAAPALIFAAVLVGYGANIYSFLYPALGGITMLATAACLGWFFALVRGRMPHGLRDLIAYALSYGAQLWAYVLLLTDRYPSSNPLTAIGPLRVRRNPVQLEGGGDLRRSRLTVFFRLLLAMPHLVWLSLWGVVALGAAIANWFATLITGTSPKSLHRILAAYVRYQTQVGAYLYLIGNPFPGFSGAEGSYPIELRVAEPERQNRWSVLFRLVLAVPALLIASVYGWLILAVAFLGWFAALIAGRMPLGLRNAGALALHYTAQTWGYLFLLMGAYPYSGPCESQPEPAAPQPAIPVPPVVA